MMISNLKIEQKKSSALKAVTLIQNHDVVALGTGSTTRLAIQALGERVKKEQLQVRCFCSSLDSILVARKAGLNPESVLGIESADICIDGADEIDPKNNLLKGGGGAHTLEKILHHLSKRIIIVADPSKIVDQLATNFPVSIEVIPDALHIVKQEIKIRSLAKEVHIREGSGKIGPLTTDYGNLILDLKCEPIENPAAMEDALQQISGVVGSGIFSLDKIHGRLETIIN